LNLYWAVSNTCSIIQQGITLRMLRSRENGEKADSGGKGQKRR